MNPSLFKFTTFLCLGVFAFLGQLSFFNFVDAWSYPLADIPHITNADYFTYRNNPTYRATYSMLRMGTYFERRDVGIGSHQGVDIVAKKGTSVFASYGGKVIVAERRGDRGNVVVLQHRWNGQTLYTTYAHLSVINVIVGQQVAEGEQIGEVGETGNASGPHLHFQIEKNTDDNHPFFPKGCQGTIDEIVNEGNCFAKVREATLDPIVFLETTVKTVLPNDTKPTGSIYIQQKDIGLSGFIGGFMQTNSMKTLTITQLQTGGTFLLSPITVSGNADFLSFTPERIQVLEGERNVFIQSASHTGIVLVNVKYGEKVLARLPILINTAAGIEERKQNEQLMRALELLGLDA